MVLNGPLPVEIDDLLARRRALGQDTFDEVWNGEYHMNPASNRGHGRIDMQLARHLYDRAIDAGLVPTTTVNVGVKDNYRVPDGAYLRAAGEAGEVWVRDAAIVVEIVSPDDDSYEKFDHYATFGVDELIIVDPGRHSVEILTRSVGSTTFTETGSSALLDVTAHDVREMLDWP